MAKESTMKLEGLIIDVLPNARFQVKLENDIEVLAYVAGKMRKFDIRLTMGDKVLVEISPYDLTKGRIIRRL